MSSAVASFTERYLIRAEALWDRMEDFESAHLPGWLEFVASKRFPVPVGFIIGTERGLHYLEEIADWRWNWNTQNDIGAGTLILMGILGVFGVWKFAVSSASLNSPTMFHQPENMLAIPGLNDFLPMITLPYLLIAAIIGMLVHEVGHGIAAERMDVEVERWGVFFLTVLPFGAFVECDVDEVKERTPRERIRYFSAGVINNLVIGIAAGALLAVVLDPTNVPAAGGSNTAGYVKQLTASLSPASNVLLWISLFNLNLALFNSLPVFPLDGGRVLGAVVEILSSHVGVDIQQQWAGRIVTSVSLGLTGIFAAGMVMPYV